MKTPNLKHSIEMLLILACCLSFPTAQAGPAPAAQTSNVNVVNTPNVNVVNTPNVTMPTNLGIPVAGLITLFMHSGGDWSALFPDGSVVDFYALPAGHELLVTDISWLIESGTAGGVADFFLNGQNGQFVWEERQILDSNGMGVRSEHLTSPIPFPVLPTVYVSGAVLDTPFFIRGYVVSL
jgi:hypothetical protein